MILQQLPKFMKAAQAKNYGDIDEMLSVEERVAVPNLREDEYNPVEPIHPLIKMATRMDRKTHMIVKTLAVAIAPGDCRVLSGKTRAFQGPPQFPYIPGKVKCETVWRRKKFVHKIFNNIFWFCARLFSRRRSLRNRTRNITR